MTDLPQFLHDRIADDERTALRVIDSEVELARQEGRAHVTRADYTDHPTLDWYRRPLQEIAAKRRIIELAEAIVRSSAEFADQDYDTILCALAAVYDRHPDYNPEWTP